MTDKSPRPHSFLIILFGLAFFIILTISVAMRVLRPALTAQTPASDSAGSIPQSDEMDQIGVLMKQAAANPDNPAILTALVESLLAAGQWQAAENFAQKAIALNPDHPAPRLLYLLSLAHHNKGEHVQAAEILEKLLKEEENPSARYSLAILYIHYLGKPEAGREQLQKGLAIKNLAPGLAKAMQEELEKSGASLPD